MSDEDHGEEQERQAEKLNFGSPDWDECISLDITEHEMR